MLAVQGYRRRVVVAANVTNINAYSLFNSPRRPGRYVLTILPGAIVGSTTTATAALQTGAFPKGCRLFIENFGNVYGKEGAGGAPGPNGSPGSPGSNGGDAIAINCADVSIINRGNIFAAGGGGAGGEDNPGGGGGTCFPRGSMVLMADKSWKEISTIEPGDLVWSPFGREQILELDVTSLGNRALYSMADASLMWSAEHTFWVRRPGLWTFLWSMDRAALKREEEAGEIGGLVNWDRLLDGAEGHPEQFACIEGWKVNTPVRVQALERPELALYLPRTAKHGLIIVNGYLVGAGINEAVCDYARIDWQGVAWQAE